MADIQIAMKRAISSHPRSIFLSVCVIFLFLFLFGERQPLLPLPFLYELLVTRRCRRWTATPGPVASHPLFLSDPIRRSALYFIHAEWYILILGACQ
jgi:hypothetical protein